MTLRLASCPRSPPLPAAGCSDEQRAPGSREALGSLPGGYWAPSWIVTGASILREAAVNTEVILLSLWCPEGCGTPDLLLSEEEKAGVSRCMSLGP